MTWAQDSLLYTHQLTSANATRLGEGDRLRSGETRADFKGDFSGILILISDIPVEFSSSSTLSGINWIKKYQTQITIKISFLDHIQSHIKQITD